MIDTNNVHVLYGNNAAGKTRFLKEKGSMLECSGSIVVSNVNAEFTSFKDDTKLDLLERQGYSMYYKCKEIDEVLFGHNIKLLWELIVSKGECLILDEPDAYIPSDYLTYFLGAICSVAPLWKEIWIAGHSPLLMRACDQDIIYVMKEDSKITRIEGCANIYEYFDSL